MKLTKHKCTSSKSLGEVSTGCPDHGTDLEITGWSVDEATETWCSGAEAVSATGGGNTPCGVGSVEGGTDCAIGDYTGTSVIATNVSVT